MCKESVLSLYRDSYDSKFLSHYGKKYVDILRNLKKDVYYQGVKRYLSKDEICKLCFDFLSVSFSKE